MAYKEVTCKAEAERENELYESVGDCDITLSQQQPFKETTAASTIREVSASKCTDTGH